MIGASPGDVRAGPRLRGQGCYVGDVALRDPLHLCFARSAVPSGRITALDLDAAREVSGVSAVHGGGDLPEFGRLAVNPVMPLLRVPDFPILARDRVTCFGQPIAAVLAETALAAMDGAEAIGVEIDEDAPPDLSPVAARHWRTGDTEMAMAQAAHVVEVELQHPRLAPVSMEPRAIAVDWAEEGLTIWHSTQTPHRTRQSIAEILGLDPERLRVIAPDVGGAFGMKASVYPEEVFAVWAAVTHRRSVRWCAGRGEDLLSATHGRGLRTWGRLAVDKDGTFLALEARIEAPLGPWLPNSALIPAWNAARILPGGYDIPTVSIETAAVPDGHGPMGIYRGAGRPEAACLMERLVDRAARATSLDPLKIRARNVHGSGALPVRTATGNVLDSGDYPRALREAGAHADLARLHAQRDAARAEGRLAGVGLAFYLEPSGEGFESARVTWLADGSLDIASGSSSQGQSRETAYAQIAAEVTGVTPDAIRVTHGDTGICPEGIGAVASRGTPIGGSAVFVACERLRARILRGEALPLSEDVRYETEGQAWGYGVYIVTAEVDRDTGAVHLGTAHCLDDAGRIINPAQVDGQVRGGFAQGLGEALMEAVIHDADGQLLTGSLMDYAVPRASDIPPVVIQASEHPSPMNALGAKGVGEAGTIGAPAAILNAVLDALAPLGIEHLDMPLTPCKVWTAINAARTRSDGARGTGKDDTR